MGKLKKIALAFLIIVAATGALFLRYWAYYPVECLEISGKATANPQGPSSVTPFEDRQAVFPETWMIDFNIDVRSSFYRDITLEKAEYSVYLEGTQVAEGGFHGVLIDSVLWTPLPIIGFSLDMKEVEENHPHLIERALRNNGRLGLKVAVRLTTPAMFLDLIRIGTAELSDEVWANLDLVGSLRVSSFEWKRGYRTVNDCNPGDAVTSELELISEGFLGGTVEAEMLEVNVDGSVKPYTRQVLGEGLRRGYNVIRLDWDIPESPPMGCVGYSIRLLCDGQELWRPPLESLSLPLVRSLALLEAFSEEGVNITLRGRGYCSGDTVVLNIRSTLEACVDLKVEPGTVLVNSGVGQNMILAEARTVRLEPGVEFEVKLEAYCLDMHRDNPSSSEVFTVHGDLAGYCPEAVELMRSLSGAPWEYRSVSGIQLALWVVVEDPPRSRVEEVFRVSESALEDAWWLLENIGVDPEGKRLFHEE